MKKVLFGIALILFALLVSMIGLLGGLYNDFAMVALVIGAIGLGIAGIGAFTREK